jgi:ABC-type Mn2+/Zn2+ transport system permease subunit
MGVIDIGRTILEEFPLALFGSVMVGTLCAFLGVYIVARRVVFLGAVLTQVSVMGLALTFLPVFPVPHTIGSLVITLITVVIVSRLITGSKIPRDSVLGVVFITSVAARILIMQVAKRVEVAEIENLLRGDILFVTPDLFLLMAVAFVMAVAVHLVFHKEFMYAAFDPETAQTQGYHAARWDMIFYVVAAVVIAFATHMVGDLFVFGFLVVPPVTALLLTRSVKMIFFLSVLIGLISPVVGLILAFRLDIPASPAIVGVASVALGAAWLWSVVGRRGR